MEMQRSMAMQGSPAMQRSMAMQTIQPFMVSALSSVQLHSFSAKISRSEYLAVVS